MLREFLACQLITSYLGSYGSLVRFISYDLKASGSACYGLFGFGDYSVLFFARIHWLQID